MIKKQNQDADLIGAYIDTSIFLNVIHKEKEFEDSSSELLRSIQDGKISGVTAAITALKLLSISIHVGLVGKFQLQQSQRSTIYGR